MSEATFHFKKLLAERITCDFQSVHWNFVRSPHLHVIFVRTTRYGWQNNSIDNAHRLSILSPPPRVDWRCLDPLGDYSCIPIGLTIISMTNISPPRMWPRLDADCDVHPSCKRATCVCRSRNRYFPVISRCTFDKCPTNSANSSAWLIGNSKASRQLACPIAREVLIRFFFGLKLCSAAFVTELLTLLMSPYRDNW